MHQISGLKCWVSFDKVRNEPNGRVIYGQHWSKLNQGFPGDPDSLAGTAKSNIAVQDLLNDLGGDRSIEPMHGGSLKDDAAGFAERVITPR